MSPRPAGSHPLGSRQGRAQVDEVVTNDAEADPALHPRVAFVATAGEPMAPLQETDSPFAAGSPLLSPLEPALSSVPASADHSSWPGWAPTPV